MTENRVIWSFAAVIAALVIALIIYKIATA